MRMTINSFFRFVLPPSDKILAVYIWSLLFAVFFLLFCLFETKENVPKFGIHGLSVAYSRFLVKFGVKFSIKCHL